MKSSIPLFLNNGDIMKIPYIYTLTLQYLVPDVLISLPWQKLSLSPPIRSGSLGCAAGGSDQCLPHRTRRQLCRHPSEHHTHLYATTPRSPSWSSELAISMQAKKKTIMTMVELYH